MSEEFYRIKRLPPYVIAEVNAMRAAARQAGEDIIDLGMGNPDLPPPPHVIEKLCEVAMKPDAHGYSASKGIPGLRKAQAGYYGRRFGVDLDPDSEVVVTLGSKEGLANLAQAITAPGDVVLAPNPSYPIHTFGFIIAGATIRSVPTTPDERYFEALERAMKFTVPKPSVLVMGYPSNPTAEVVDLAFYERVVAFAKEHGLWVLSDLAYSELYWLADRFCCGQQDADCGIVAGEILPGLWRLHTHSGCGRCRDQWPARHCRRQSGTLQEAPGCAG